MCDTPSLQCWIDACLGLPCPSCTCRMKVGLCLMLLVTHLHSKDADYAIKIMNMIRLFGKPIRCNRSSQDKKTNEVGANLFIGNLEPEVDEKMLYDTFSSFGVLLFAKVMRDPDNGPWWACCRTSITPCAESFWVKHGALSWDAREICIVLSHKGSPFRRPTYLCERVFLGSSRLQPRGDHSLVCDTVLSSSVSFWLGFVASLNHPQRRKGRRPSWMYLCVSSQFFEERMIQSALWGRRQQKQCVARSSERGHCVHTRGTDEQWGLRMCKSRTGIPFCPRNRGCRLLKNTNRKEQHRPFPRHTSCRAQDGCVLKSSACATQSGSKVRPLEGPHRALISASLVKVRSSKRRQHKADLWK